MTTDPTGTPAVPEPGSLAARLLDAQVAFHLDRLDGEHLSATVTHLAEDVLAAAAARPIDSYVGAEEAKAIVARALTTVPGSAAVSGIVELAVQVAHEGPEEPYPVGDLVDRGQVERLVDELLALSPLLERGLDRLAETPLVGTVATRFMGRVVAEVLQANKAVADKVPGLGSLMSIGMTVGSSAASRMMGAADKQLEGLLGDTVGKGGAFAVRRLNRILVETLRDPTTRGAILEVWDLLAAEQVRGLDRAANREELAGLVDAVHDVAVTAVASQPVAHLGDVVVDAFFDRFGAYTPTELLDELDLSRDDLVADIVAIAPSVVEVLRETGDLERILRSHLVPFYASAEVTALLHDPT